MSTHQRLLSLFVTAALITSLLSMAAPLTAPRTSADAVPAFSMTSSKAFYTVGETGTLSFNVAAGTNKVTGLEIHVAYDKTKISVDSTTFPSILENFFDLSEEGEIVALGISSSSSAKSFTGTTTVATIGFTALAAGDTVLQVTQADFIIDHSDNVTAGTKTDKTLTINAAATSPSCPGPYHVLTQDNRCVWSCGTGTTPDNATNECVCQAGKVENGTDTFGRRVCAEPSATPDTDTDTDTDTDAEPDSTPETDTDTEAGDDATTPGDTDTDAADTAAANDAAPPVVEPNQPPALSLTSVSLSVNGSLQADQTAQMIFYANYSDGQRVNVTSPNTNPNTRYTSSNSAVANVTCAACSQIIGKSAGTTTITASYTDNSVTRTDTAAVTVTAPPAPPAAPAPQPTPEPTPEPAPDTTSSNNDTPAEPAPAVTDTGSTVTTNDQDGSAEHPAAEVQPASPEVAARRQENEKRTEDVRQYVEQFSKKSNVKVDPTAITTRTDSDGDGLTDEVEKKLGTNPFSSEDEDKTNNGVNDSTKLILGVDVQELKKPGEKRIVKISSFADGDILTDLQPSVFGTVSKSATKVDIQAVRADYATLQQLNSALNAVANASGEAQPRATIDALRNAMKAAAYFGDGSTGERRYPELQELLRVLNVHLEDIAADNTDTSSDSVKVNPVIQASLKESLEPLQGLVAQAAPVTLGTVADFGAFSASQEVNDQVKYFHLRGGSYRASLADHKEYTLKAVATLGDGSTLESAPVLVGFDSGASITTPRKISLNNKTVPSKSIVGGDERVSQTTPFIHLAFAEGDTDRAVDMVISEGQPIVAGATDFNSQVFAVWESVVLASSVISDSEEGSFTIQAPKQLTPDESHKVTLYAMKDVNGKNVRSKSVTVHFRVSKSSFSPIVVGGAAAALALLALTLWGVRRLLKKRASAPTQPMTPEAMQETLQKAESLYQPSESESAAPVPESPSSEAVMDHGPTSTDEPTAQSPGESEDRPAS